jgi:asparagine synthase (glutamine-hydrolysing)
MCGIAGFLDRSPNRSSDQLAPRVTAMTDAISHRGPDDSGLWLDAETGVALGHRRLSILDLSAEGHQPMISHSGDLIIVFNGEIYNFQEIRKDLESSGERFRGHSDTEVMLEAFDRWGMEASLRRFNGMFAFAVWDRRNRTLHLSRDRIGKKPLYYGWAGSTLLFGSELKALRAHPAFNSRIDRNALALYMRLGYIPAPYTIYENTWKLPAASFVSIRETDTGSNPQPQPYWSAREAAESGLRNPIGNYAEAQGELDALLRDSVALRMISDVPLGAFLSGGIDSSLIVALMQAQSTRPVKTFCIGFQEQAYNEADHARLVAQHLGTDHTELTLTSDQALEVVPRLPQMFDEPFADSSQIPTFLVSEMARRHVTVSLSGDGGDELFAGYTTYQKCAMFFDKYGWMPNPLKATAGHILRTVPQSLWNTVIPNGGLATPGARLHRLGATLGANTPESIYLSLLSFWEQPASLVRGAGELPTPFTRDEAGGMPEFLQKMMLLDSLVYLPDDILVKVDRASMAVSLEARGPLLDYRLFEFAWRVPSEFKVRNGQTKWILRDLLSRYVPREIIDRPKAGFAVPIAQWLRGPLRGWAEEFLGESRIAREGFLDVAAVRQTWSEHQSGRDWSSRLWAVLMFESWLESTQGTTANPVLNQTVTT